MALLVGDGGRDARSSWTCATGAVTAWRSSGRRSSRRSRPANVTIPLALAAALAWRFRERAVVAGLSAGLSLAAEARSSGRSASGSPRLGGCGQRCWRRDSPRWHSSSSWACDRVRGHARVPRSPPPLAGSRGARRDTRCTRSRPISGPAPRLARPWRSLLRSSLLCAVGRARPAGRRPARVHPRACGRARMHADRLAPLLRACCWSSSRSAEPRLGPVWFVPLAMYGSTGTHNGTTAVRPLVTVAVATLALAVRRGAQARRRRESTADPALATSPAAGRP